MIATLLLAAASVASVIEAPPYRIIHPASLEAQARQVAGSVPVVVERLSRALDAPGLEPCTLYLVDRDSVELAGGFSESMPDWAAGIAVPSDRAVVIRADRVGPWRQRELTGVLAHETAHMLMGAAAGPGAERMPPWFREGVASNLARDGEWLDFFYLWVSPIPSSAHPLDEVSAGFSPAASPVMVRAGYAGSYSFVRYAIESHRAGLPARVLAGLRGGLDFEAAWLAAAGGSLESDEAGWSASIRGRTRWAAILTSSATLWLVITLMVLIAWMVKRRRGIRAMERWSDEEPME